MDTYRFRYLNGQSMPYQNLKAADDAAFYKELIKWERENGFRHVKETLCCVWLSGSRKVPEPLSGILQSDDTSRFLASLSDEERRPVDPLAI